MGGARGVRENGSEVMAIACISHEVRRVTNSAVIANMTWADYQRRVKGVQDR
jgi:hypothetical protein